MTTEDPALTPEGGSPEGSPGPADTAPAPEGNPGPADTAPAPEGNPGPADTARAPEGSPAPADTARAPEGSPAPADTARAPEGSPAPADAVRAPTRGELAWYGFARSVVFGLFWLMWRMRFVGTENLPQTTAYVVAPVHRSYIDTVLAGLITRRRFRFMGKGEMWETPWVAKLFTSLGGFPVRRGTPDREALKMCEQALLAGEPVVLFPEGTRQSGPIVRPLFAGPAFIALRANVPIVPLGIGGSERAMPKGSKRLRPGRVALVVGRPIWPPPASESGRASRRVVQELTDRLQAELQVVFDEAQVIAGP
jgi:1-acyl-sn-glycerol-3-phosphate acyltransferase